MNRRIFMKSIAALGLPALGSVSRAAAGYPERPVEVVIPFAPGGSTDQVIRPVAAHLGRLVEGSFVVINKPGAGGAIGAAYVARAKADGYTLLVGSAGPMIISPLLRSDVGYDPFSDFVPISILGTQPLALAINPKTPAKTVQEFVGLMKSNPDANFFGSSGPGSLPHLTGELFASLTGTRATHVPFRGGAPAVEALIAGDTTFLFDAVSSLAPLHETGRLRVLAVCDMERSPLLADVPTSVQAQIPKLISTTSNYMLAPKGTSESCANILADASQKILSQADVIEFMKKAGVRADASLVHGKVLEQMKSESLKWKAIIDAHGIKG